MGSSEWTGGDVWVSGGDYRGDIQRRDSRDADFWRSVEDEVSDAEAGELMCIVQYLRCDQLDSRVQSYLEVVSCAGFENVVWIQSTTSIEFYMSDSSRK